MAGPFETIYDSMKDAAGFFFKAPKALVLEFTKVAIIGLGVQLGFLFLVMATGVAAAGAGTMDLAMIGAIIAVLLMAMAFFVISTALSATTYCIAEGAREGRKVGIISKTRELIPTVAGYCGIVAAILGIVFGLALGGGVLLGGDQIASGFLMLGALCAIVVAVFLFQFALPEMAVGKSDAIGALKNSFALVSNNVWTVLLFDVILLILLFGTVMAFSVPQGLVQLQMASAGDNIAVSLLLFSISLAASLLETVIVSLIAVSLIYSIWKGFREPEAPAEPVSKKRAGRR